VTTVVRGIGWTFITSGVVVLLYVVYLLWFTGLETAGQQQQMAERFESRAAASSDTPVEDDEVGDRSDDEDAEDADDDGVDAEVGDAYAALWFERDGEQIVNDDVLYVVEGTTVADLKRGPGHYEGSAAPGEDGNFSIAGHRTTYGSPFWSLEQLSEGDTIHVLDLDGTEWVYEYREQLIVQPSETWVVEEPDPIDLEAPTITLTTCHPRSSAAQRLIAFGELVGPAEA
jgi:sortase A